MILSWLSNEQVKIIIDWRAEYDLILIPWKDEVADCVLSIVHPFDAHKKHLKQSGLGDN